MFAPLGVELVRQADLGVGEAEEPFRTFVENALAKARFAAAHTGLPAVADDAGLCVDAFGGLPGVDWRITPPSSAMKRATTPTCAPCWSKWATVDNRRAALVSTLVAVRNLRPRAPHRRGPRGG